eukprot:CAMPEP_0119477434 /NCGR_PEP_ID=MMETSP1344-20130328/7566_1 /TAXON_ID=236787 /ORGANISM="Florenciella parvula, Strain CCMP2471" /LENGTH=189 /DNA_ID=CAMNT_0007511405 /DNA_START=129 /DNA_END=695 /DNA_ORIENTATION=-
MPVRYHRTGILMQGALPHTLPLPARALRLRRVGLPRRMSLVSRHLLIWYNHRHNLLLSHHVSNHIHLYPHPRSLALRTAPTVRLSLRGPTDALPPRRLTTPIKPGSAIRIASGGRATTTANVTTFAEHRRAVRTSSAAAAPCALAARRVQVSTTARALTLNVLLFVRVVLGHVIRRARLRVGALARGLA